MITTSTSGQEFIQQHSTPMPQPLNTDWKQRLNKKLQNIFINKIVDASYIIEQHIEKELASQKQELIKRFEEMIGVDDREGCSCKAGCEDNLWARGANDLRADLRAKLQELKEST